MEFRRVLFRSPDVPGPAQWLADHLTKGARVNIDGQVLAVQAHRQWQTALSEKGISLVIDMDAIGDIWEGRPALPQGTVFEHLPPFACRSRAENMAAVRAAMLERKADWHWLSSLADIACLLNLRGNDVSYNPGFLAPALIGRARTRLFFVPGHVPP